MLNVRSRWSKTWCIFRCCTLEGIDNLPHANSFLISNKVQQKCKIVHLKQSIWISENWINQYLDWLTGVIEKRHTAAQFECHLNATCDFTQIFGVVIGIISQRWLVDISTLTPSNGKRVQCRRTNNRFMLDNHFNQRFIVQKYLARCVCTDYVHFTVDKLQTESIHHKYKYASRQHSQRMKPSNYSR